MKDIIPLGMFFLFLGIILIFLGALSQANKSNAKVAVGGFIGFIPFGFANDKKMMYIMLGLTIALFLFFVIINFIRLK